MKVAVTGACGFIGSHMVEVLARGGHEVAACDLPQALDAPLDDRTRFPEVCRAVGADLRPLDLTDPSTIPAAVMGAEIVFHVAAVFDYTAPESLLRAVNVEGTRSLLEVLVDQGTCRRVVNWGAGGIYGPPRPDMLPFKEDGSKRPTNPYLVSKWDQERLAHAYRARGIEVTSVRPTTPYGPRAEYGSGQLLIGLAERPHPVAFKNMTGNIPFVHVRDLCAAALYLATYVGADGESYNVSDDGRVDAIKLARIVASEMGTTAQILPAMPLPAVRKVLSGVAKLSMASAKRRGKRSLLEYDQVQYFGRDYRYSNDKLKETGFRFAWPDPEPELRATLRWYIDRGWLKPPQVSAGKGRVG